MKTNFFETLAALNIEGDWNISIKSGAQSRMLVSVLFTNEKIGDHARKLIPPLLLKGTPQELGEGFFGCIENPVRQTASLLLNMEDYLKGQEQARLKSRMEQDKKQKAGKEKDSADKKYEALMKKVEELEQVGKYREAYGQLPKAADYPEHEEELTQKKNELMEKFGEEGLFAQSNDNE